MRLSNALELSRKYLCTSILSGSPYLCLAIIAARKSGEITQELEYALIDQVMQRLNGRSTLAGYLHDTGRLPEVAKGMKGGYDLYNPMYIVLRDEFINNLLSTLRRREAEYAFS